MGVGVGGIKDLEMCVFVVCYAVKVDMFLRMSHVETVVLMSRVDK